ncbi:MAG TPA: acyltransferase [Solirubrobacteraceae bacterium]|nr:acyltransferase [Solirubrobacteraceae bacterium]
MNRSPRDAVATRDNSFDLVRLGSCMAVVFSHSFALAGSTDPVHHVLGFQLGTVGVFVLFALSGYLLAASLEDDRRQTAFWIKRALRLWPGLIVSVLLTAFVLGPIISSLSPGAYFGRAAPYTYVLKQGVFDTFGPHLPGVFVGNPVALVVNGSLWTLPLEVCCYAALAVAAVIGALRRPRWFLLVVLVVCVVMVVVAPPDSPRGVGPTGVKLLANALRPCGALACGSLLWLVRDRVPRTAALVVLAFALLFVPVPIGVHSAIDVLAVPYLVAVIGSLRPGRLRAIISVGDVSYGAYIYGFPIQQLLAQYIGGISPGAMLAISAPLAWLAGLLSWHLVERRALALRRRLVPPRAGAPRSAPPEPEGYAAVSR